MTPEAAGQAAPAPLELSLAVVGLRHQGKGPGNRAFEVAMCSPGEPVELRREPRNPADPRAVAVYSCRGIQMGYVTAERAPLIGSRLEAGEGYAAVFQQGGQVAAVIRVRFGGGAPTLPLKPSFSGAERQGEWTYGPDGDAFYPDPEPGEWGA